MSDRPDIKITDSQKYIISWAIKELAESQVEHYGHGTVNRVNQAIKYLNEFLSEVAPAPKITEKEADLSSNLHTYMRKYMDGSLSVILYRMIDEGRGKAVWLHFIQGLIKNKYNIKETIYYTKNQSENNKTTDDLIMLSSLELWVEDGLKEALKTIWEWK